MPEEREIKDNGATAEKIDPGDSQTGDVREDESKKSGGVADNEDESADKLSQTSGSVERVDYAILENISPSKELDKAIDKQKRTQKQIFESLIDENVKLERELKKREESFNQLNAKYEVKCIELDALQVKTRDLENKVKAMERDFKLLTAAAHKAGLKGERDKKVTREATGDGSTEDNIENNNNDNEASIEREKYKIKIHDLQSRLIRMAEDDEAKSRRISEMEGELAKTRLYVEALEGHVPKDVREEMAEDIHETKPKGGLETWGKQANVVYVGTPQNYQQEKKAEVKESVVCVVS